MSDTVSGGDQVEMIAKLKLDTSEAEAQLSDLAKKSSKKTKQKAVSTEKVPLPSAAKDTLNSMFTGKDGLVGILDKVKAAIGKVAAVAAVVYKLLEGTDTLRQITTKVNQTFDKLRDVLSPIISLVGDIVSVLLDMVQDILPFFTPAINLIANALSWVSDILKVIEPVIEALGIAMEWLNDIISKVISTITFGLIDLSGSVKGSTEGKKASYKTSLDVWETSGEDAYERVDDSANALQGAADSLNSAISNISNKIGDWASKIGNAISSGAQKVWDFTKSTAESVWQGIKGAAGAIWDNIKSAATGLWEGAKSVGQSIGSAASNVWDKVKSGAKNLWNKIKFWDDGGSLGLGAQVWAMNEKGNPEFVFNSGGHDSIVNADSLEKAMYNALRKAMPSSTDKLEVSVKEGAAAGPRELAQWILPSLKFLLK